MAAIDSYKQLSLKIFKIKPARIDILKDQKSDIHDTNLNLNLNQNNNNNKINTNINNNRFL